MTADGEATAAPPDRVRIRFWGTRGTCPSPGPDTVRYGGNTSCLEVRDRDGGLLVLDAGTGLRALGDVLHDARHRPAPLHDTVDGDRTVHIVLSHRHGDHVLGLPHFAPLLAGSHTVCLHCGNSDAATLRPFIQGLLSPPMFPLLDGVTKQLDACDWSNADEALVGTRMRVRRFAANHPGEAAVLRVDDMARPVLAYAPDNELAYGSDDATTSAWRTALAASLRGIPVLVHDATYSDAEITRHAGWGHSSAEEATRFALECEAETLVLFHHHPNRTDDAVDAMLENCRAIAGSALTIIAAREGQTLEA